MLDAMPGIGTRVGGLGLGVGVEHHVDSEVAVGVDAHLEAGAVHLHDVFLDFLGGHGEDTVVAVAADVGLGEVGGAGGDSAVGDHLDAAEAEHFVAEAGLQSRLAQGRKMWVVQQGVDAEGQVAGVAALLVGDKLVADHAGVVDAGEADLGEHAADGAEGPRGVFPACRTG